MVSSGIILHYSMLSQPEQVGDFEGQAAGVGFKKFETVFRVVLYGKIEFTHVGGFITHEEIILEPLQMRIVLEFKKGGKRFIDLVI